MKTPVAGKSAVRSWQPLRSAAAEARLASIPDAPKHISANPRAMSPIDEPLTHPLARGRYQTPLRYPGAKTGLADVIGRLIDSAKRSKQVGKVGLFVEPFAGGASTSLRLVGSSVVDRILLADADPLVAAFWQVAAAETEKFVDRVTEEHSRYVKPGGKTALSRWDYWRSWTPGVAVSKQTARFEAAVKCFFLNRTTFSGILHGSAGPIGGRDQSSKYDIGCRFNVAALTERIRYVGHLYESRRLVDVWCKHWENTLADVPEWYPELIPNRVLAYLDPPYIEKSKKLYQTSFDVSGGYAAAPADDLNWADGLQHHRLAEYLRKSMQFRWVLSYDAHPTLLADPGLYAADRMTPDAGCNDLLDVRRWRISKRLVSLRYTASARSGRGPADELLLTTLPPSTVPIDEDFREVPR